MFRFSSCIRNSFLTLSAIATFSSPAGASLESSSTLAEACTRPNPIGAHAIEHDRYPSHRESLVYSVEAPSAGLLQIEAKGLRDGTAAPRVSFLGRRCAEPEASTGWEVLRAEAGFLLVALEHSDRLYFRLTSSSSESEGEEIAIHASFQAAEIWQEHEAWSDTQGGSRRARITHFSFGDEELDFYLVAMDGFQDGRSTVRHRALIFPHAYAAGSGSWAGRITTQTGAPHSVSEPIIVDPDPDTYHGGTHSVSEPIIVDPDPDTFHGGNHSVSEPIIVDPDPDTFHGGNHSVSEPIIVDPDPDTYHGGTQLVSEPIIVDPDPDTDPLYAGSETDRTWLFASSERVILDFLLDSFMDEPAGPESTLRRTSFEQEW